MSSTSPARAQASPESGPIIIEFDYRAPVDCMDEDSAFGLVHGRSQRVERGSDTQQRLTMVIEMSGRNYKGVLIVQRPGQPHEERSVAGGNCDEVVEALALTAALSIDPHATLTLGEGEPTEREETSPVPSVPPPTASDLPDSPPAESADRRWYSLGPTLAAARLMTHAMHGGAGVAFSVSDSGPRVFFPLETHLSVKVMVESLGSEEPNIRTRLALAQLSYCVLRVGRSPTVLLCPMLQGGLLQAESLGFDDNSSTSRWVASVGVEGRLQAEMSDGADLWLAPHVARLLTERRFGVDPGPTELSSTVAVTWGVAAGFGWGW